MEEIEAGIGVVPGFLSAGIYCGIKANTANTNDLGLIVCNPLSVASGVFTKNVIKAAPLIITQKRVNAENNMITGIIINSGNANACTGDDGIKHAKEMTSHVARLLKVNEETILVASTGVIGILLPIDKILSSMPLLIKRLATNNDNKICEAIMTTDKLKKKAAIRYRQDGTDIVIGGIAKGSGMIYPNMATMLSFICSNCNIDKKMLDLALKYAVDKTFNMITVDGETSTNDMVICMANSTAGNKKIDNRGKAFYAFREGLLKVCERLAKMIIIDGEGATKFIEVVVSGSNSQKEAKQIARAIANSNLVKTAIFGRDPNWGRILSAAGSSRVNFNLADIVVKINNIPIVYGGIGVYANEALMKAELSKKEINISLEVGCGKYTARMWTCDLTYDYIKINASYRT